MPVKAEKRLRRELERLQETCAFPIVCTKLQSTNIFHWKAMISASNRSPFVGGKYELKIEFPRNYPIKPPEILFTTPMYHPNISANGAIGIDILGGNWSPSLTIDKVLLTICGILDQPMTGNKELCYQECVILYTQNRLLYEEMANDCAVTYAGAEKRHNLKDVFIAIRDLLLIGFGDSAFNIETIVVIYVGLDITKLNKWCKELELDNDNRYKRLLGVQSGSQLFERELLTITYVTLCHKTIVLQVWNDLLIKQLKMEIKNRQGLTTDQMVLLVNGERLYDDNILIAQSGIINGSSLHMLLRYNQKSASNSLIIRRPTSYSGIHHPSSYVIQSRYDPRSVSKRQIN